MSPSTLPDGWRLLPFREIAESITERIDDPASSGLDHYVGLEHLDRDTLEITRWGSPSDVEATKLRFYPGDVIYARRRAYQRKLGVAVWEGICSAHALVLRARRGVCLAEFLPYFLQSDQFHQRALDISVGSLSPTINWKALAAEQFMLPPLDRQRYLVETFDEIRAERRELSAALDAVDLLSDALSAEEYDQVDSSDFVELRTVMVIPPQNGLSVPKDQREGDVRLVNMGALFVDDIVIDDASEDFVSVEAGRLERFQIATGDLLFARRSIVLEGAGRCVMVGRTGGPAVFESSIIRARADTSRVLPEYLLHYLHSPRGRARVRRIVRKGAVSGIAGSDLKQLLVPVPQKRLQERAVRKLGAALAVRASLRSQRDLNADLQIRLRESLLRGSSDVQ